MRFSELLLHELTEVFSELETQAKPEGAAEEC